MKPGRMPQGGGFNMNAMMKQVQKMQQDMANLQEELALREFSFTAGGGAVTAVVSGMQLKSIDISPDAVDPDDVDMLCDLVLAAVNGALSDCKETTDSEMEKITGQAGNIPGLF